MPEYLKKAEFQSAAASDEVAAIVSAIVRAVEKEGLAAVRHYSAQLDGWDPEQFMVSEQEIDGAAETVPAELKKHLQFAIDQVRTFAMAQRATLRDLDLETLPGVTLGHRHVPVRSVGSYAPGGRYPLIASSIMTVAVPKVAGVSRVVACAPPRDGLGIHPAQLYAMASAGADEIYCIGGGQALAAMAFGIEDMPPVDMLVGAGNGYLAEAKRQLFGQVGIDLIAGPTEILIIADEMAEPELLAADMLGQAEHGPTSPAVLLTTSLTLAEAVREAVDTWLRTDWPTAKIAGEAWRCHGEIAVCQDDDELVSIADQYAPEHLEVQTAHPDWFHARLSNYGSLFLGQEATVASGYKAIGPTPVLPTGPPSRHTGGLWVGKFLKTVTYQKVTPEGTREVAPAVAAISSAEMMDGHALTARMRLELVEGWTQS